jgi:MoaA/NifB/PqqE/SkfB family radical SAM enzyme
MLKDTLANIALSYFNFSLLSRIVTSSFLFNIPYKIISQRLIDWDFPVHLFLESTNVCNLKCVMCPRHDSDQPLGYMNMQLVEKIINECKPYGKRNFCLHLFGEPLISPELGSMIAIIKKVNPLNSILLTTNGVLLKGDISDAIIEHNVDKLVVSLSASDPETYKALTQRDSFATVVENIKDFCRKRDARGSSRPIVYVRGIHNKLTEPHLAEFKKLWKGEKVVVDIRKEHNYGGNVESSMEDSAQRRHPCYHLWFSPGISWDGKMFACCADSKRKLLLGDVTQASISSIWKNSDYLRELRIKHLRGEYGNIPACRDCNVWRTYPDFFFSWQQGSKARTK